MDRHAQLSLWRGLSSAMQELIVASGIAAQDFPDIQENSRDNWLSNTSLLWADIFALAALRANDPAIALKFGKYLSPANLGPLGYAFVCSANAATAMALLLRYWPIISDEVELSVERVSEGDLSDYSVLVITSGISDRNKRRYFIESILSGIVAIAKLLLKQGFKGLSLTLDYSPPAYALMYDALLETECTFDADRCAIFIPNRLLACEIDTSNPYAQAFLRYQCELISSNFYVKHTVTNAVCWAMVETNELNISIVEIAAMLKLSERTLRRKLVAESTSFSEIKDRVKRALAEEYLRSSDFTVEDIALLSGYSEISSFKRAFKRWHNMPPSSYRQASRNFA